MSGYPYVYRWNRPSKADNRKGQRCRLIARGKLNSILLEFPDGFRMVTSGNAIRRAKPESGPQVSHKAQIFGHGAQGQIQPQPREHLVRPFGLDQHLPWFDGESFGNFAEAFGREIGASPLKLGNGRCGQAGFSRQCIHRHARALAPFADERPRALCLAAMIAFFAHAAFGPIADIRNRLSRPDSASQSRAANRLEKSPEGATALQIGMRISSGALGREAAG